MPEPADANAEAPGAPAEPEIATEAETTPKRGIPVASILAIAAAALAVTSVVLLLLYLSARKDHNALQDELRIRTTASRFAEAFVALDSSGPLAEQDSVVAELGTGPIIAQHTAAMASLREAYKAFAVISARGDVKSTYVSQIDDSATEATVIVNLTLAVTGSSKTVPNESYLQVHMVKLGGAWKVDNIIDIRGLLGPQPTTPTTSATGPTTTAPESPASSSSG